MNKRREEREIFGRKGTASRYQMRQKLVSIGDDFVIENEQGQKVYMVDGKVLRIRKTLDFKDMNGRKLCQIQQKLLTIKESMAVEDAEGKTVAVVKKALIAPLRERYTVRIKNGPDMNITGNILDYEYMIEEGGRKVAEISRKWFRLSDTYGVEIAPGEDDVLILAVTVAVDMMSHGEK
ncbi:MAG: LURP-one-related family protein [Anaerolineales bacterium]|nr:LURP-one-related family protein [Anaerolineales bacterium]